MSWLDRTFERLGRERSSSINPLSFDDYVSWFEFNGNMYAASGQTTMGRKQEDIGGGYRSLSQLAFKQNGVIFACVATRMLLFGEARFQFRRLSSGRPGDLFGDPSLIALEKPWPGGTTRKLLNRAELDNSLAGNSFWVRRPGNRIKRLRPDWTVIALGSMENPELTGDDVDAEVLGFGYQPGGPSSGRPVETYTVDEVAHYAPFPDPDASYRGMSWISPVIREVMGDKAATDHKLEFFEHAATTNLMVKVDPQIRNPAKFTEWVSAFRAEHEGKGNKYKTLFLGGGSDATAIGANLQEADFKAVQGAGETRIAAAAQVPPVIVGLAEGLEAATYANYASARRRFVDMTMRPLWGEFAGSMQNIVPPPDAGAELWYDDRDIPALRENEEDLARIRTREALMITALIKEGYEPDSAVAAVVSGDWTKLKHSGALSVQLQAPGSTNGTGNGKPAVPVPAAEDV